MQVELRQTCLWPDFEDLLLFQTLKLWFAMHTLCFVIIPGYKHGEFLCDFSSCTPILPDHVSIFVFICLFFEPAFASLPLDCLEQQKGNAATQDLKQLIPQLLESLYLGKKRI